MNSNDFILSDISKISIFECYQLVMKYLDDDDIFSEERLLELWADLEIHKICIPQSVYNTMKDYVHDHIDPIVYETDITFDLSKNEAFLREIVKDQPDGSFDYEAYIVSCNTNLILFEIREAFEQFAMDYLYPLLVS